MAESDSIREYKKAAAEFKRLSMATTIGDLDHDFHFRPYDVVYEVIDEVVDEVVDPSESTVTHLGEPVEPLGILKSPKGWQPEDGERRRVSVIYIYYLSRFINYFVVQ